MNRQLARVGGLGNQEGSLCFHDDSEEGGRFGRLLSLPLELSNSLLLDYKIAQLFNTASLDCIQPDRNPLWQNLYGMETIGKRARRPNYSVLHHDIVRSTESYESYHSMLLKNSLPCKCIWKMHTHF